jgi:hypothetical protein
MKKKLYLTKIYFQLSHADKALCLFETKNFIRKAVNNFLMLIF